MLGATEPLFQTPCHQAPETIPPLADSASCFQEVQDFASTKFVTSFRFTPRALMQQGSGKICFQNRQLRLAAKPKRPKPL